MMEIKKFLWYMWTYFKKYRTVFSKYYGNLKTDNVAYICINLRLLVHSLEKGMSLKNVKPGFGKEKAQTIIGLLKRYQSLQTDYDYSAYLLGIDMLRTYNQYMQDLGVHYEFVQDALNEFDVETTPHTGIYQFTEKELYDSIEDFASFAKSRHSVRYFSEEEINLDNVKKAIALAQTAPSACNRQSCSVYVVKEKEKLNQLIPIFLGTAGIENIGAILCVVSDLNHYFGLSQSNAQYVDGGIFTMNLLYALHDYRIATCPLIWSDNDKNLKLVRDLLGIKENYVGICAIAIGNYPEGIVKVARSHRRESAHITHII